jgi:PAS domain S-box-containing protein
MDNDQQAAQENKNLSYLAEQMLNYEKSQVSDANLAGYAELFEFAPSILLSLKQDGTISLINFSGAKFLGDERTKLIGRNLRDFLASESMCVFDKHIKDAFSNHTKAACEVALTTTDGQQAFAHIETIADHNKQTCRMSLVDITDRKRLENVLRFIVQQGWSGDTGNVFATLAQYLGEILAVDHVFIARLTETPDIVETVTFFSRGKIIPNITFALGATACVDVLDKNLCYYPKDIQTLFPNDNMLINLHAESFAGVSLWDASGQSIGLIAVIDSQPFPDRSLITLPLKLVAIRAAAELEHLRSDVMLHALSARQEDAHQAERKRIAQDLHDELGQQLSALRLDISLVRMKFLKNNPLLVENIEKIIDQVDDTIHVVRNVASRLRPAALDLGIASALEWHVREFAKKSGLFCELDVCKDEIFLDEERIIMIFRIVQECLTNVLRHAQAKNVQVSLQPHKGCYLLKVRDDGKGYDPEAKSKKTFGLIGIQERVLMLKGELSILSAPNQGTTVKVRIPAQVAPPAND